MSRAPSRLRGEWGDAQWVSLAGTAMNTAPPVHVRRCLCQSIGGGGRMAEGTDQRPARAARWTTALAAKPKLADLEARITALCAPVRTGAPQHLRDCIDNYLHRADKRGCRDVAALFERSVGGGAGQDAEG